MSVVGRERDNEQLDIVLWIQKFLKLRFWTGNWLTRLTKYHCCRATWWNGRKILTTNAQKQKFQRPSGTIMKEVKGQNQTALLNQE